LTMAKKKRVPPRAILVRYIRLALLNVIYWINDYRPGGPEMVDPLETYRGMPYFGFVLDPTDPKGKRITLSPICSPAKEVPDYYVQHMGQHKRKTADATELARQKQERRIEEEEERKNKERLERMAEKKKREELKRQPAATAAAADPTQNWVRVNKKNKF